LQFRDALNLTIQILEPRWVGDAANPELLNASVNSSYQAGTWRTEDPETDRDTVELVTEIYSPSTGQVYATAGVHLPYTFVVDVSVMGPPTVHVGEWAAMTVTAENAYSPSYTWRENGVLISEASNQHSVVSNYPTTYAYDITVTDGDGDSGLATHFLQVIPYAASITGYAEVRPYATCMWWASTDLPSPPYEYEWRVDDVVQSTAEYFTYVAGTPSFTIAVQITNSVGQFAWGLQGVSVSAQSQECFDM
jgi:hypothetical protein